MPRILGAKRALKRGIMRKFFTLALAALFLGARAWAGLSEPKNLDEETALIQNALQKRDDKKFAAAAEALQVAANSSFFQELSDLDRYKAMKTLAEVSYQIRDFKTALRATRVTTEYSDAGINDWYMRTWAAYWAGEGIDAIQSATTLLKNWPKTAPNFDIDFVGYAYRSAKKADDGEKLKANFARALLAAQWQPRAKPPEYVDFIWFNLARYDLLSNNYEEGERAAKRITDSFYIASMHAEKIFDPIVTKDPGRFDPDKALQIQIDRNLKRAKENPRLLQPIIDASLALIDVERAEEAATLIDDAVLDIRKYPDKYTDSAETLNWLYDTRARVLVALGRRDEAYTELKRGTQKSENGGNNVSQIINLASAYLRGDRPKDALDELETLGNEASSFGIMLATAIQACATSNLKDERGAKKAVAYIDAHTDDDINSAVRIHLCTNDLDGAARFVIAGLAKPSQRSDVIMALQIYRQPTKVVVSQYDQNLEAAYAALRERNDVKQALEPYGRIININIPR